MKLLLLLLISSLVIISCFRTIPSSSSSSLSSSKLELNLFNFGKKKDTSSTSSSTSSPVAKVDPNKVIKLEKISRTQNRDYNAEAAAIAPKKVEIKDKQIISFNYQKSNQFPNLYKGWIRSDGDQIAKQMISSAKSALNKQEKYLEILFDPVPNLDEVSFGTVWNKKFRGDVTTNLKVPDVAASRGIIII